MRTPMVSPVDTEDRLDRYGMSRASHGRAFEPPEPDVPDADASRLPLHPYGNRMRSAIPGRLAGG
jgi:hypothetical protein